MTAPPGESRLRDTAPPPRHGGLKSAGPSPLPDLGEGASPPGHSTCAPWDTGVPGPPRDLSQEPKALPGEGAEGKGWEARGGTG